ncbi:MAG: hypothetical protein MPN21_05635, partial [Thermoanaerobaculia bacterium]|nr:hypothetical protein [Thermoanaerobaculia bacterium]
MRQKAVVCLAAVLTTGWTGSLAATPPTDPRVVTSEKKRVDPGEAATWEITEREFLAPLLEASSLAVLSLSKEVGALQAELALARIVEQPELDAAREDLGNEGTETEMTLSWRPPRPDRKRLEVEAASERLTGADASFERSLLELQLELRRIYADWAIATARLDILDTEAALLGEMTVRLRKRAEVGEASGLQARRLGLAELDARARAALGRSDLGVILGEVGAWRPDLIQSRAAVRPVLPELNQAPETDAGPHPEVAALEAELRAAELSVEMADKVATMPSFVVGWKRVELAG